MKVQCIDESDTQFEVEFRNSSNICFVLGAKTQLLYRLVFFIKFGVIRGMVQLYLNLMVGS